MADKIVLNNLQDTVSIGQALATACQGGEIFAVSGPLGAGKTSLAQSLAFNLGVKSKVNSPTFNIIKTYKVVNNQFINKFIHIDAYRLKSADELINLGFEEICSTPNSVIFIEWADKIKNILSRDAIAINMNYTNIDKQRFMYIYCKN